MSATGLFEQAMAHHRAGQLVEAERLYHRVLGENPDHGDALFLLAGLDLQSGRASAAVDKLNRATAVSPANAAYFTNLGEAYRRLGKHQDAMRALLRAMQIQPRMAEPVFNLGVLMEENGVPEGALACFQHAAELKPDSRPMQERLVRAREGQQLCRSRGGQQALVMMVAFANHLSAVGAKEKALDLLERALALEPGYAGVHNDHGVILLEASRPGDAVESFRRSLAIEPDVPGVLTNLGSALGACGRVDEEIECYRRSLAIRPDEPGALSGLGFALGACGRAGEAVETMRRAIAVTPDAVRHSNVIFTMAFDPDVTAEDLLAETRAYDRIHARPVEAVRAVHRNDPGPERRLRIGYVSPDLRDHCQALFMVPVLSHHDHERFEITCYSSTSRPDETTRELQGHADRWRDLVGVDDAAAAGQIRADGIDVLVDLTMHMGNNRLLLFARRPAPVQVCWLAYPGTTGLGAMDYRISDPYLDPPGAGEDVYQETSVRLPDTFWCYDARATGPDVSPLPAIARGHVTYGCLNNFVKVNPHVLELWARVLLETPRSRLVVMAPPGATRQAVTEALGTRGVDAGRIDFVDRSSRQDYLARYRGIDICLDTFPYNGHTTSLDACWMGVPVVTMLGRTVAGRAGLCLSENLGLPELVARTQDEYVRIATGLAGDLEGLARLRASLRARMEASPLMDAPRFVRNLEAAYRHMWRRWCESRPAV
jgi:predicted O-linked N-acetylglucosamine transferase (SPINDLY family)